MKKYKKLIIKIQKDVNIHQYIPKKIGIKNLKNIGNQVKKMQKKY